MTNTDAASLNRLLRSMDACSEAREWARDKTPREAWEQCPRSDWLLWIAARLDVDRTLVVRATARCAETALPHAGPAEPEARAAIEAAHRWADDPTPEHAEMALAAAYAAADAAGSPAEATYAASYAARAAYAAGSAAYAARAVAYAVADAVTDAAADAAYAAYAARDAASAAAYQRHADIVREIIPYALVEQAYRRRKVAV